jgi:hypothetical protein
MLSKKSLAIRQAEMRQRTTTKSAPSTATPSHKSSVKPPKDDLTGLKIGRWTVLSYAGRDANYNPLYTVQCECGRTKEVHSGNLTTGQSNSCVVVR